MKYILFIFFALFSLSASAQFPGQNTGDIVSDSTWFEWRTSDSVFLRVNRIEYSTGAFNLSAVAIGDSNNMRNHLSRQYLETGNEISRTTQAYFNLKKEERKQRIFERAYQRLFRSDIQEHISNTAGFAVIGNYRINSTVQGFVLNRVDCEVTRQGQRLRLTIPGQQAFVVVIQGDGAISLQRGNNILHTLFGEENPPNGRRTYRNADRTITLMRR